MPGALVNGAATSDRVVISAAASINSLSALTYIGWYYPTTIGNLRRLMSKLQTVGTDLEYTGVAGALRWSVSRTVSALYITNSLPITTNSWYLIAATFDASASPSGHIYIGTFATPAAEPTYLTSTAGSGPVGNDSATDLFLGNQPGALPTRAFQGRLGPMAVFPAALSLADVQSWQRAPRSTVGSNVAAMFGRPGKYAADFIEYAGLTATVVGPTQGDGAPVDRPWNMTHSILTRDQTLRRLG